MKIQRSHFHSVMRNMINNITDKVESLRDLFIEVKVLVNNEITTLRTYAPSNYRQVWAHFPKDVFDKYTAYFSGEKVVGEWVRVADHDSCWEEGYNLTYYHNWVTEVDLLEITIGRIPMKLKYGVYEAIDNENGDHLLPITGETFDFRESSMYDFYVWLMKKTYVFRNSEYSRRHGESIRFDFLRTTSRNTSKVITMWDRNTISNTKFGRNRNDDAPKCELTAENLKKLLRDERFELYSIW